MYCFELSDLGFLLGKALTRGLQLTLQELGCIFRLLLTFLQIFIDEELRELGGDSLGEFRSWRGIRNIECRDLLVSVPDKLDYNIITHPLYFFIWIEAVVAARGIKVQLLNYMKETRAAENLLFNVLQPALKIFVDVWSDIVFGHRRLLYQDQRC